MFRGVLPGMRECVLVCMRAMSFFFTRKEFRGLYPCERIKDG